ncbi:MAG: DUF1552 domain-containing protein [Myxococcota bacterium]|nr:DUF1552 domain-containing protein [Myxococcota bacterium]
MRFDRTSRRLFLTGAGGALLALPFLPSLLPRSMRSVARAGGADIPRRFVAIKTYNGSPVLEWYPTVAPSGYTTHGADGTVALSTPLAQATGRHSSGSEYFGRQAPLSDFAASGISRTFGPDFNRHADQMLLFRGLDFMPGLNHNHGGYLGNFGLNTNGTGGPLAGAQINATIDHVMAASPSVYASAPSGPRILHVGSRVNTASYAPVSPTDVLAVGRDAIRQAQAFVNPRAAFDAVFGTMMTPGATGPGPSARLVDRVIEDYRRASSGPHLSRADRDTLERHVTYLTELEARVNRMDAVMCDPTRPTDLDAGGEFSVATEQVSALFDQLVDLIAVALACDATRIVTLDVTKMIVADGGDVFGMGDSENATSAGRDNWHFQAHQWDESAKRWLGRGVNWVAQSVVLRLLDRLAEITESDGETLLHHSLVMWSNELSFNHLNYSMPTATWGSAGGYLRTGRYLDYVDHERPIRFRQHDGSVIEGVQFNRLLVTIMQAMGLAPGEYEREPGRGFGETATIAKGDGFALDYDDRNVGEVLPDIRA